MNVELKIAILKKYGKQWKFAEHIGVNEAVVSRAITGSKIPNDDQKRKIAEALDMKVEELFAE